jgi:hypothetical protein
LQDGQRTASSSAMEAAISTRAPHGLHFHRLGAGGGAFGFGGFLRLRIGRRAGSDIGRTLAVGGSGSK